MLILIFEGGNLEQDKNDLSNNLLTFDTMTSEWKVNEQIGKLPSARYGHSMVLTDTHAPGSKVNLVSFDKGKTLSSSMEYRKIKMWIVGKYKSEREHCRFRFLLILPPSTLFHCHRFVLLYFKTPKKVIFNVIHIFNTFATH